MVRTGEPLVTACDGCGRQPRDGYVKDGDDVWCKSCAESMSCLLEPSTEKPPEPPESAPKRTIRMPHLSEWHRAGETPIQRRKRIQARKGDQP